jgi:hypothetical protein
VAETTVKRLLCAGFDGTSVRMLAENMSRNKCFSRPGSNIICFTLYIHL